MENPMKQAPWRERPASLPALLVWICAANASRGTDGRPGAGILQRPRLSLSSVPRLRAVKAGLLNLLIDLLLGCIGLLIRDDSPGTTVSTFSELAAALAQGDGIPARAEPLVSPPARSVARAAHAASRCAVMLFAFSLIAGQGLNAQAAPERNQANSCQDRSVPNQAETPVGPAFIETPDPFMRYLPAAHPETPVPAAQYIAIIESNAPGFRPLGNEPPRKERFEWVSLLLTIEYLRINEPAAALRPGWYEFVAAKAPALSQPEMDAIAEDWWSAMGNRAIASEPHGVWRDATWEEVRGHFQTLRTGTAEQASAAKYWLIYAENADFGNNLTLAPEVQGVSPLAVLLARDIEVEARIYAKPGSERLRKVVGCLIAGKFAAAADGSTGIARTIRFRSRSDCFCS